MIVITGATGHVGGLTAKVLDERGARTRLLARDPDRLPAGLGTETAVASYEDSASLAAALEEGDRVFMVSIHAPFDARVALHRSFVEAAARAGVAQIVYLSFVNASESAVFSMARSHGATEQMVRESGVPYTVVRTGMYLDHLPSWFDPDGVIRGPGGSGRISFSYRPDVAQVIASVLTESGHEGAMYDATSPESISMAELAAAASEATGDAYGYEEQERQAWIDARRGLGRADWEIESGATSWDALRQGEFDVVSSTIAEVGHVEPLSIAGFLAAHAGELPLSQG